MLLPRLVADLLLLFHRLHTVDSGVGLGGYGQSSSSAAIGSASILESLAATIRTTQATTLAPELAEQLQRRQVRYSLWQRPDAANKIADSSQQSSSCNDSGQDNGQLFIGERLNKAKPLRLFFAFTNRIASLADYSIDSA